MNLVSKKAAQVSFAIAASVLCAPVFAGESATKQGPADGSKSEPAHACRVKCTEPHAACDEAKKVLDILQKLVTAYSVGDIETYEKYLDDNCVVLETGKNNVVSGKADVLKRLKTHFIEHQPGGSKPLKSFHIDQPFAKVSDKGDTCVVTFVATKEVGGSNPHTERANVTDVFVKRNGDWKKLHWQGKWEVVSAN